MQKKLELSLSLVIDWLKFAEAKNATLIAANGAAIFGALSLFESNFPSNIMYVIYIYQALLFLFLSAAFCLISFIPQVYVPWLASKEIPKEKNNLLAYADIANYDPELYLETMYKQEKVNLEEISPFEKNLSELIVLYSRIALRKFSLFNLGVWCLLSAIVTPIIALGIYFIRRSYIKA